MWQRHRWAGFGLILFALMPTLVRAADDAAATIAEAMDKQPDAFAEAKKWLADEKSHVLGPTSKMKRADVKKLVDDLYAAGAVRVYFIGLEKTDGVEKSQLLTIVLPSAPAVRTKIAGVIDAYYAAYLPTVGLADLAAGLKYQEANQPVHPMNLAF
jgi:hypothetical protein